MLQHIVVRKILPKDNVAIANIIRTTLEEFNANKPGTVYFDASTDNLFELFEQNNKSEYFVAEVNNTILGGAGFFATEALPPNTCELVKMYLSKQARGLGLGRMMINHCIANAKKLGYESMYLETMPELKSAIKVYEKFGFEYLQKPLGNTGHCGCDIWMLRKL